MALSYDPRFQREAIAPIQDKLGQFLASPVIGNILGQVMNRVSIPFVMDNQRLFVASLSKGKLGHDKANLLGSLLVTQLQPAAMARTDQPENERRDFYLFIDEFQNFSTDAFASILAEARKYRLCLTLSHQYVDQLSLPVRQAVFGNVGTLISFRIGKTDAEVLQAEFGNQFIAQQFVDLDGYELVVKLLENGTNRQPFKAMTFAPYETATGRRAKLISRSRERFASPRSEVEEKLKRPNPTRADPRPRVCLGVPRPTFGAEPRVLFPRSRPWHDADHAAQSQADLLPPETGCLRSHVEAEAASIAIWISQVPRPLRDHKCGTRQEPGRRRVAA